MVRAVVIGGLGIGIDTWSLVSLAAGISAVEAVNVRDRLRDHYRRRSSPGVRAKAYMDAGDLVPGTLGGEIVLDGVRRAGDGWILHDWPRKVEEAEFLAEHGQEPTVVIEPTLDESETMARLGRRCLHCRSTMHVYYRLPAVPGVCGRCGGQLGQPHEVTVEEIRTHREAAAALTAHYRGRGRSVRAVSALGEFDDVAARIAAIVSGST
ncbi:nucleoside monophosphate kinase [Phytomonospora sp. NPDC050363]|uniref:adenylate kinase family protein n=1 Tax=Phytomonospora sp. NPDC050363 TaxID=3155642 RepID=UPI0033C51C27